LPISMLYKCHIPQRRPVCQKDQGETGETTKEPSTSHVPGWLLLPLGYVKGREEEGQSQCGWLFETQVQLRLVAFLAQNTELCRVRALSQKPRAAPLHQLHYMWDLAQTQNQEWFRLKEAQEVEM
jgi:hypothetical protein